MILCGRVCDLRFLRENRTHDLICFEEGNVSIKFKSAVLFVKDMAASRRFYEEFLAQQVEVDFGANVGYVGGLALWEVGSAYSLVYGDKTPEMVVQGRDNLEVYFETADVGAVAKKLADANVPVANALREQPWGQRVLHVYDPDKHIVEIAEPLDATVRRLSADGLTPEEICKRTMLPPEAVAHMLAG